MFLIFIRLDLSSPVYETDSGELLNYITNNQKNELASVTNTTVVGLFRKEDKKGKSLFVKNGSRN